jgi:signal transduction histidine kinase
VSLERFPYIGNSDFHDRRHLTSWKSLIYAEKERESIKKAILEKKVALSFFHDGTENSRLRQINPPESKVISQHEDNLRAEDGTKILIADDECDLVEMLAYNLRKKGYQIIKAHDGFEAWEKIESEKPSLVILDLMMPNLDGWELCRLIRRNQKRDIREMGILMLTAKAMPEDRVCGLEIGADDYLTKPFSLNELILRVEKLIEKKKSFSRLEKEMGSLRSSMEKKESNLSKVVHDLRSPLISMGASAKRMLRKGSDEEAIGILKNIYDSSLKLTQWIDDTVLPSKGSEGKMKEVDIRSMVKQVVELLGDVAREKDIEIRLQSSDPVPPLLCNEHFLQRALTNLISNAFKYTPGGGRVEVSVTPYLRKSGDGGVLEISVKDTGVGIPEEDIERIFEPFYRGKNVTTESGIGLGLFFVKEAVDLHGGRILVQTEPNKGSTFSILLPVGNSSQREEIEKQQSSSL